MSVDADRSCGEYSISHGVAVRLHNLDPLLATDMGPYHAIVNNFHLCYARIENFTPLVCVSACVP